MTPLFVLQQSVGETPSAFAQYVTVILLGVGVFTLGWRVYQHFRSRRQSFYIHLSQVWYKLHEQVLANPEFLNPEHTTMQRFGDVFTEPKPYDAHAWMCWALAEDCFVQYSQSGKDWEQFELTISRFYELHRAWLDREQHKARFGSSFVSALDELCGRACIAGELWEILNKSEHASVIDGNGVVAIKSINRGAYLGRFHGPVRQQPGEHTLQVGLNRHLDLSSSGCDLRFLNHSYSPNAVVRGLNLYALNPITVGEEILINYNATEWQISGMGTHQRYGGNSQSRNDVPGFKFLAPPERASQSDITHIWIRDHLAANDLSEAELAQGGGTHATAQA